MIKRLRKLNDWLLLVKELVAHWGHTNGSADIFLIRCDVSRKKVSLKVIRTGASLLFSDIFSQ